MLFETVKREELIKIRKVTAEDFHNIGNKLTGIVLLADILERKSLEQDNEQKLLLTQIKENANYLYRDVKDILWSLDPQSNNLVEVLNHIKYFAIDIFDNDKTHLMLEDFVVKNNFDLPVVVIRNIFGIFKELFYNILKNTNAEAVTLTSLTDEEKIRLIVFAYSNVSDEDTWKKVIDLDKVKTRLKRISGVIEIEIQPGKGAQISLILNPKELTYT